MCYFWVENVSNLIKLIVCGSQSTQQTRGQRVNSYASGYEKNVLVKKGIPTNM